jgi:hypothetical protein
MLPPDISTPKNEGLWRALALLASAWTHKGLISTWGVKLCSEFRVTNTTLYPALPEKFTLETG